MCFRELDDDLDIQSGASGTWVISVAMDFRSLPVVTVYGQVIGDDVLGDVYMISMRDIIEDLSTLLKAHVRLPSSLSELEKLLSDQYMRKHGDELESIVDQTILEHNNNSGQASPSYRDPEFQDNLAGPKSQEEHNASDSIQEPWKDRKTSEYLNARQTRETESPWDQTATVFPDSTEAGLFPLYDFDSFLAPPTMYQQARVELLPTDYSSSSLFPPTMYPQPEYPMTNTWDETRPQKLDGTLSLEPDGMISRRLDRRRPRGVGRVPFSDQRGSDEDLGLVVLPAKYTKKQGEAPRSQFPTGSEQTPNTTGKAKAEPVYGWWESPSNTYSRHVPHPAFKKEKEGE